MKKKGLLIPVLMSILLQHPAVGFANNLAKADGLFEKGLYQKALKEYEASRNDPMAEIRLKALYRAVESQALLFRYAEAAQMAFDAKIPADPLWKSRFLILRAELAREFLKQYGFASPKDVEEGQKDLSRRTPQEWREEVRSSYRQLWDLRRQLVDVPLREERYFVDLRKAELETTPSLWDFVVLRWSDYLLGEDARPAAAKPAALSFIGQDHSADLSAKEGQPAAEAAAIFENAANLGGQGRAAAREFWKIKRIGIPFDYPSLVKPAPDQKIFAQIAIERLTAWADSLSTPLGRAEAGLFAAELSNRNSRFAGADALCRKVEKNWPLLRAARRCAKLRAQIELPVLNLSAKFVPPGSRDAFHARTRNLPRVYLRLYHVDPEELLNLPRQYRPEGWSVLRQTDKEVVSHYLDRAPDHAWTADIRSTEPYAYANTDIQAPVLKAGVYLALASSDDRFKPGNSLLNAVFLNVTDLFLVASSGIQGPERDFIFDPSGPAFRQAPILHFYTFNGVTGEPIAARIDAFRRDQWQPAERSAFDTDGSGRAQALANVKLAYGDSTSVLLDPLARRGESYAYSSNPLSFGFSAPAPVELFLETDRPIYRPGQKARAKVTVLRRIPRGYKVYDGGSLVNVQARDANGQEFFKTELKLNAMGSAQTTFTIPAGRLLGHYTLNASLADFNRSFSAYQSLAIEEYKRPEFEVEVNESTAAWKFGQAATVSGIAKYYFGGAVPDAPVSYRVYRERYIPWFCWWWRGYISEGGRAEILSGHTNTDAQGRFSFALTPQPADSSREEPWPATFVVEVESRDPGGRAIQASRSFRAGATAYLFDIAPTSGFLSAGKASEIPIRLMSLNEQPVTGSGSFELHRLLGRPKPPEGETDWSGSFPQSPSLEVLFKDVADGPLIAQGDLVFTGATPAKAALRGLEEGLYRLTVRAKDPWGASTEQSIVLLAAGAGPNGKTLALPAVAIAQQATALMGETARVLMGSSFLDGAIYVEIWGGRTLLERRVLAGGGIRMLSVPVGEDHKGGFTVRWFGARDFKIRSGQVHVNVPWSDRELSVKLRHDPVMKPGEKVTWSLVVSDRDKKPVLGEAVVRIFDRSLEYYTRAAAPWVSQLFAPRGNAGSVQGSLYRPWAAEIPIEAGWIKKMLKLYYEATAEPNLPRLRLNQARVYGYMRAGSALRKGGLEESEMAFAAASAAAVAPAATSEARDAAPAEQPPVHVRSDFSETAFFEPQLAISSGRGVFSFKVPEQLTSWKIQAYALTRDVKRGEVAAEAVTRKDLMVQVEMPRFLREGDEGVIKTVIHNETDQKLTGELTIVVEEDGKEAAAELGLSRLNRSFAAVSRGLAPLSWKIKAPRGSRSFKVRAIARSGHLADAEEKDLLVLPSRERLVESSIVALDGIMKKVLRLPAFYEPDPTRINESMTLQVDPQLALSILNSLPFLAHCPYEGAEQLLNRYVPLAVVNSFYKKNPALAQAAKKIPKRDTITPAWDRSDPRRLSRLMETPWEEISKGGKSHWPIIDMFDDVSVERELEDALGKLKASQNSDGGFPWFPGGRSDPYITLLVLSGFAEAQRYNVAVPVDLINRALSYVNNEIPKHLKPHESEVSLILYAAYAVTSYPKTLSGARLGWQFAKVWADYADTHAEAMTPLGKAYAAFIYWRLGEKAKGDLYLNRALDGARQDPVAGVYWAPEKISWLWYNDTVEKHAFFLRSLLALRPKDPRIPGMVQWLLFNRKGNEWKSTKASAAAIFSLLDVLRSRGALDQGDAFRVEWGADVETARVEPYDWLEKPLRWTKNGAEVGAKQGTATIQKDGPGLAFASLSWIYTTDQPAKASGPGMMELSRRFFLRSKKGDAYHLTPLNAGDTAHVGDQIEVQLKINTRGQFEYAHLKDPKIAGFEAEELLSGWKWDQLSRYEEQRDSLTNFFIPWLPHGEYILRYRLRPTTAGRYRLGAAVLQSMYSPEMAAHSEGFWLNVTD